MNLFFLGIGLAFLIGGICYLLYIKSIKKNWIPQDATVTNVEMVKKRVKDSKGHYRTSTMFAASYYYEYEGNTYTKTKTSSRHVEIGDTISLLFNPKKPDQVFYPDGHSMILVGVMIGCGLLFGAFGVIGPIHSL